MAARTIPFPNPPGNAATQKGTSTPPPPPPIGAAKLLSAPRRYRGLHLVSGEKLLNLPVLNRLAQTQAIVAQVEREVARQIARRQQANRAGDQPGSELTLLSPVQTTPSLPVRAARKVVFSLFPL